MDMGALLMENHTLRSTVICHYNIMFDLPEPYWLIVKMLQLLRVWSDCVDLLFYADERRTKPYITY